MNEAEDLEGSGPDICLENHEGPESRLARIPPETGTEHLQNTNLERYRALTRSGKCQCRGGNGRSFTKAERNPRT
jgi:hypothetical protein